MILFALLSLALSSLSQAETLLGHNLTPTSGTLRQGEILAGSYALAVGINDHLTVGTSPWLIWAYNMPALSVRYGFDLEGVFNHLTIEQLYFKTFHYGYDMYQQESGWTRVTASRRFDHFYTLHTNLGLQYFADDKVPFSMRPIPTNQTPITWSTSVLQELNFTESLGAFIESGFLAFNYPNRYAHFGLSGFYKWPRGYVQLGLSKTIPIGPDQIQMSQFEIWENSAGDWHSSVYRKNPAPFHPEVQVQILL